MSALRREAATWLASIVRAMPGSAGQRLRAALYPRWAANTPTGLRVMDGVSINGWQNITLGNDVTLGRMSSLEATSGTLTIGDRVALNHGIWIGADQGEIEIGAGTIIGPYSVLRAANHRFDLPGVFTRDQGHSPDKIIIGRNVWIGAHVTVLPGAVIGDHAVIGAGSVVSGTITDGVIAVGSPARAIRDKLPA
jgi:galactoside O-acetyltransferase